MAIRLYKKPDLKNSIMLCGWPGIGNIGMTAIESLRTASGAEEFGQIEPWDIFNPRKVVIEKGILDRLEFPSNKFYFQKLKDRDLVFFIGQEQPTEGRARYAEGKKAYEMANLVLDVAQKLDCKRIYTSGAAVTQIHHTARPRVWAVPNDKSLIDEIKQHENTVLMSGTEGGGSQGIISGLNGLMLGVAKSRGIEAICLMGEIPYYLQGLPWPYPKASKSVLEVLAEILGIKMDFRQVNRLAKRTEENIEKLLESLYRADAIPPQLREEIEKLKHARPAVPGPITEEEQKRIMEHLDELFREGDWEDDESV